MAKITWEYVKKLIDSNIGDDTLIDCIDIDGVIEAADFKITILEDGSALIEGYKPFPQRSVEDFFLEKNRL